jgi:hypothetical protein
MLERTLKNLEGFLKVSLEYFHPTQLSFTRMAVPDLVEGLLFQARSHANGTPVEVQAAGAWGDTTVLVDPGHLSKVLGIAVGHLGKGVGAGTRIHIGVERCTRRDGMGLEVRFTLSGPSEGTAPVRTSDAGIEWAVAQKVIALHGGELAERADEGGAKALTLFLPLSPSSPVEV